MSLQIRKTSIQKLTHPSVEIRLRAFDQINGKFRRALAYNEQIEFKSSDLCKQLIRWFGVRPIPKPTEIFELILELLNSKYGAETINKIGTDRMNIELSKLQLMFQDNEECLTLINSLFKRVQDHTKCQEIEAVIKNIVSEESTNTESINVRISKQVEINSKTGPRNQELWEERHDLMKGFTDDDYEIPYSFPTAADYNVLKSFSKTFLNRNATKGVLDENLLHLTVTLTDYPPEYFLQPPHTFCYLIDVFRRCGGQEQADTEIVTDAITTYLFNLEETLYVNYNISSLTCLKPKPNSVKKTQIKLKSALNLLIEACLFKLDLENQSDKIFFSAVEIFYRLREIFRIRNYTFETIYLDSLQELIKIFKTSLNDKKTILVDRIKYLTLYNLLCSLIRINFNTKKSQDELNLLKPLISDYPYKYFFKEKYEYIKQMFFDMNPEFKDTYKHLNILEKSIQTAVSLLKRKGELKGTEVLASADLLHHSVKILDSLSLMEILMSAVVNSNMHFCSDIEMKIKAFDIIGMGLKAKFEPAKVFVYSRVLTCMKLHLASMMNNEQYDTGVSNKQLLEANILGAPLSKEIMDIIILEGLVSENKTIKEASETIIMLLLKSRHLLRNYWFSFFDLLIPNLPLLLCYAKNSNMTSLLMEIVNPDGDSVDFKIKLIGNIVLLYHENDTVRSEALVRLIFMVQSMPRSDEYVPEIKEIQDVIPSDVLIQNIPKSLEHMFSFHDDPNQEVELRSLLEILHAGCSEPLVRKSTLLHLNVMCKNVHRLNTFCEDSAYYLILESMENALKKSCCLDYKDAVEPCLGILYKSLLYDASLREKLFYTPNIYMILLRSLFLFIYDEYVRQNTTMCLFLLIFHRHIDVDIYEKSMKMPKLAADIHSPIKFEVKISQEEEAARPDFLLMFPNQNYFDAYIRHHLASCYNENYNNLDSSYLEKQLSLDLSSKYLLTSNDLAVYKATRTEPNLKIFISSMQNATSHDPLIKACEYLKLQMHLDYEMPENFALASYKALEKYIQVPPGNLNDFKVFVQVLGMFSICIRLEYEVVVNRLCSSLINDSQHPFIYLLKDFNMSLDLYHRLSKTIVCLVQSTQAFAGGAPSSIAFLNNMFDLYYNLTVYLFEKRDIARCRCLLMILNAIVKRDIKICSNNLISYIVGLIKLSVSLRNLTQTGSTWQRNCLEIVCLLLQQLPEPQEAAKLHTKTLKFVTSLGSHSDKKVRALSWTFLVSMAVIMEKTPSGLNEFIKDLAFLPGGIAACSLGTFLDSSEAMVCRQQAATLFLIIMPSTLKFEEAMEYLVHHAFFGEIDSFLDNIFLERYLPVDFDFNDASALAPVDLLLQASRILYQLVKMKPEFFKDLIQRNFMNRFYEVLKYSNIYDYETGYSLCAEMCKLYALAYSKNFDFLQKTLCRDHFWLQRLVEILELSNSSESDLNNIIQMLTVLAHDPTAYHLVSEYFYKNPKALFHIIARSINIQHIDTVLQKSIFSMLTFYIVKIQETKDMYYDDGADSDQITFLDVLDKILDKSILNYDLPVLPLEGNDPIKEYKSYYNRPLKNFCIQQYLQIDHEQSDFFKNIIVDSVGSFCFIELYRVFCQIYSTNACKFKVSPTYSQFKVGETLGILLKFSSKAKDAAENLNFLDKIIKILRHFFEEMPLNCSSFIRRYGDVKKNIVLQHLTILINIIVQWYSSPMAFVQNDEQTLEICALVYKLWPWMHHSYQLKVNVVQMCAFLAEHSLIVCKIFSTTRSPNPLSIAEMTIKNVYQDTFAYKIQSNESFLSIVVGIRLLVNICSCTEGRLILVKCRVCDIFDSIQPFNSKGTKVKVQVLHAWLEFWDVFSRYPEGATIRYLSSIFDVLGKLPFGSVTRVYCLKILRNMSFLASNRTTLLTNADFLTIIDHILSIPLNEDMEIETFEEQALATIIIWKLITAGYKYISQARGTNIAKRMKNLTEYLEALNSCDPHKMEKIPYANDVLSILEVVLSILNNY